MNTFVKRHLTLWFLLLGLLALTGCTAQKLQPTQLDSIRSIGIVSLLPTELRYTKIGVTVFNNEFQSQPVGDALNEAARTAADAALRKVASRKVLQLRSDVPRLNARYYAKSMVMSDSTERIQEELRSLAQANGLDAIAVIGEVFDSDQGRGGVRIFLRAGLGDISDAALLPDVVVQVVDRTGKALAVDYLEPIALSAKRPDNLPWEYRLEKNLDAPTRARMLSDMERAISGSVVSKFERVGF